jgi:UDP-N-acetylmuramoyl-tripeptide--D-alanyl-D-alanine ligase
MPRLADLTNCFLRSGLLKSERVSPSPSTDLEFTALSTDSRTIRPGQVFLALVGEHFDGHEFITAALRQGAVAAVVSRPCGDVSGHLMEVSDTLLALQAWALDHRQHWAGRMIAVTGSNGKTTVKQMIHLMLCAEWGKDKAWATPGNLNNHIGVPLSLLGLAPQHQAAVLELGMNHPDEIEGLAALVRPEVALVNNAQREHQEFMQSVAAAAFENGQVFQTLSAAGVAVYPRDPAHESIWRAQAGARRQIRFGLIDAQADDAFSGEEVLGRLQTRPGDWKPQLQISFPDQTQAVLMLQGTGAHVALNALAAASCAYATGCSLASIKSGLEHFVPVKGRGLQHALPGGGCLVDDTYNANPDSVRAAIDALIKLPEPHALVLGDMGEVGSQGEAFHQEVLDHAAGSGLSSIWLHGTALALASRQMGIGRHFSDLGELVSALRSWIGEQQHLNRSPSVWIKGSRFMRMERVIEALMKPDAKGLSCS